MPLKPGHSTKRYKKKLSNSRIRSMQPLSLERINNVSPYKVWSEGEYYFFNTDYGVKIRLEFDADTLSLSVLAYWFNITNVNLQPSPHDKKVMPTIWTVVEEFFRINPEVLLYICDSANDQEAMRARLFKRWFNLYEGHERFYFKQMEIPEEHTVNYVSIIFPKDYPDAEGVIAEFDRQEKLFKSKPQGNSR